ncbi:MAG: metallophosphoesterase, partial [Polyangiaceae bacterium]
MSLSRIIFAIFIIGGIDVSLHYYIWGRLVRQTMLPAPWDRIATGALIVLALSIPVGFIATRFVPRAISSPFLWVVYIWLGLV